MSPSPGHGAHASGKGLTHVFHSPFTFEAGLGPGRMPEEGGSTHAAASRIPLDACFEVQAIDGKGMGAIATRDIKLGERVLAEKALFVLQLEGLSEECAAAAAAALGPDQQRQFFELCQDEAVYGATRTPMRIFQVTSRSLGSGNSQDFQRSGPGLGFRM